MSLQNQSPFMSQLLFSFDSPDEPLAFEREADAFGHVLSPEQARVRDASAGHLVVVAGAGTGKTELLTQRVLKLLLDGNGKGQGAELEEVVALTFTNKAAAEMRTRVYRALVRRLRRTQNASERARLQLLRARFGEHNRIWTFDSLGARLLELFPEHSSVARGARLPTAGEERALVRGLSRAFWKSAGTFDENEAEELFAFLEIFDRREDALALVRETARRSRNELEGLARLPLFGEFAQGLLDLLDARLARMWRAHERGVEAIGDLDSTKRAQLLDAHAARSSVKEGGFLTTSGWSAPFARTLPDSFGEAARLAMARRLLEWRALGEEALARREALLRTGENGGGDPLWEREWRSRRAVASLARFAMWWQDAEKAWKQERSLADFGDVTRAALALLEQPEVTRALRAQIAHLLVDEFQDTNRDQWRIVQGLRRHVSDNATEGNTLVVGDPKQAIYDFRGGDLTVFEAGRKTLESEGAQKEQLSISRRSAPALVEWTNRAFAAIFPPEDSAREAFEAPHGPLVAAPEAWKEERAPGDKPGVCVLRPLAWRQSGFQAPVKANIEGLRIEAAHALATWLLELFEDARILAENGSPGEVECGAEAVATKISSHLKQSDFAAISGFIARGEPAIAVLFADNTVKSLFENVLRARGVPFESLKGRGFYSSDAVRWSVLLWRALLDPDDEAAWTGLLRCPLGGQSDVALLERFRARRDNEDEWQPCDALDCAMWRAARERFDRWRKLAGVAPASLVLERVLEESELAFFEAALPDAPVRRENWRKVLDMVREREAENEGGLRALVDFFEAQRGDDREPLAPLPSGASIQLMTVHASKGLGFPACVLAQLESPKREGGDKTFLWGEPGGAPLAAFSMGREREDQSTGKDKPPAPLAYELLKRAAFERSLAEWKRLLYVACTRAASHLVLLETDANSPSGSWGAFLRPALGGTGDLRPSGSTSPIRDEQPKATRAPVALEEPKPLNANAAREIRFDVVFGEPSSSLKDAVVRGWIERQLRSEEQDAARLQQDVPFGVRGNVFERQEEWIVGAWEWIVPLSSGELLLVATGENRTIARNRAAAMRRIAQEAELSVGECFALWNEEEGLQSAELK